MNSRYLFSRTVLFLVSVLITSVAFAELFTPKDWLEKMQKAVVEENYRGIFMFSRGDMSSSMSIVHRYESGIEKERLKQLDGEMGEIIRTGTEIMCILPGNKVVTLDQSTRSSKVIESFAQFDPNHEHYRLSIMERDRVCDRPTVKLNVTAVDDARNSYVLWLDKATGLLLKSHVLSTQKDVLEQFQYTHIEFVERISDEEFAHEAIVNAQAHKVIPPTQTDQMMAENMMWQTGWTPPGFNMMMESEKPGDNVMLYTDGLAMYSVFVEPSKANMMPEGASVVGATVAYSKKLDWEESQFMVTVVGEVPAHIAMKVAGSVRPMVLDVQ